ncbi:MAG: YitT family protein [Haliscomenobacter sp.]|uniref:YitT family protein n=1 Tax=Haliscomenobacter sp. TaxID=2717303 RepID=UPI0029B4F906|nr:YitT family protein [Haliscomenobacter sp.]MDX2068131.1 YitT family protein [Haliscomenobacter sp.]
MNSLWTKIILNTTLRKKKLSKYSNYVLAKGLKQFQILFKRRLIQLFLLSMGVLSAGFGLKGFLLPNHFIDGGAVGISLLISEVTDWPLSLLLLLVNFPFVLLGLRTIGLDFAVKTAIGIVTLALAVEVIPYPQITEDKLLVSVFGGFFLGAGIGLSMRGGGVIDGTEVLALNISKRSGLSVGDLILIFNIIIFSVAAYLLSIETALYSILTYLAASKTVDFIVEGIEEYTGVTIISPKSEDIRQMIIHDIGRGVTIYKGERGFGRTGHRDNDIDIIFTVITRLELSNLKAEVEKIDPNAFILMHSINDTKGGMIKKRPLH